MLLDTEDGKPAATEDRYGDVLNYLIQSAGPQGK
jgi:hypothetical protein